MVALVLFAACGGETADPASERGSEGPTQGAGAEAFDQAYEDVEAYPIFVSSEIVVGRNRFLVGLLDADDAPIGSPDISVAIDFFDLEASAERPAFSEDTSFVYTVPGERGLYVAYPSFDRPGKWGAEVSISGEGIDEKVKGSFQVRPKGTTPEIGERVPSSRTPTARSPREIARISTDSDPIPRFYSSSIAEAVRAGDPFVVTFATPKFCASQVCGPTLDVVKEVSKDFPGITFIHVEVYSNLDEPSNLKVVPSVEQWGLPSEPWVFVVGPGGELVAKYEGAVAPEELTRDLRKL